MYRYYVQLVAMETLRKDFRCKGIAFNRQLVNDMQRRGIGLISNGTVKNTVEQLWKRIQQNSYGKEMYEFL